MEIIAKSVGKTIYKDGDKRIKVFDENYSKSGILNEALNQARIEETALNIPKILEVKMIEGKWALVMENVEGMIKSIDGYSPISIIVQDFLNLGYNVKYQLFNTADYGVPQTRKRVIIMGVRKDLKAEPCFPEPFLSDANWVTAREAIEDLWTEMDSGTVPNHTSADYSKAKFQEKGQGNKQIEADKPSVTIRAEHHGNIEGHYRSLKPEEPNNKDYWRRLSVRECARLQSFPDSFVFPCKSSSAYRQIGNAVPPVFAWRVAESILDILESANCAGQK
jgi:DNA (cytosine-5)-methyltransferase 1